MGTTKYQIEIEIFEGENCDHHQLGQKFKYSRRSGLDLDLSYATKNRD